MKLPQPKAYKRTGFYRYFLSYCLLMIVLLGGISIVVNVNMIHEIENRIHDSNAKSLDQLQEAMDSQIKNFQHISNSIANNPKLISLYSQDIGYKSFEAARELSRYCESSTALYDIGVVYPATGTIVTPNGVMTLNYFFGNKYHNIAFSSENFSELCNGLSALAYFPLPETSYYNNQIVDLVLYIQPIPIQNKVPSGFVIFLVNQKYINAMLEAANIGGDSIVHVASNGTGPVLSVSDNNLSAYSTLLMSTARELPNTFKDTITLDNERFYVIKCESSLTNLSYLVATPLSRYLGPVNNAKQGFILAILLLTGFGLIYSLIIAIINYRPIRQLADSVPNEIPHETPRKCLGEIEWIASHIANMKHVNDSLLVSLNSKQGLVRQQLMHTLLTCKDLDTAEIEPMLKMSNMPIDKPLCRALIVEFDSVVDNLKIVKVYFKNFMEDSFADYGNCYCVDAPKSNVLYFMLNTDALDKNRMSMLIASARIHMLETFGCLMTTGVGTEQPMLSNINISFQEALDCLKYKCIKGAGHDIYYTDIKKSYDYDLSFLNKLCGQLEESLKFSDYTSASAVMNLIASNVETTCGDPGILPFVSFSIFHCIKPIIERFNFEQEFMPKMEAVLRNEELPLQDMCEQYLSLCHELCGKINTNKSRKSDSLYVGILNHVSENLSNKNLTLETVAEHFGLTASYLTRFFKMQNGQPLMKHIDSMRLEKAKRMLKTTNESLEAVIGSCGYVDKDNFGRKFKRIEGMTPMQYRKLSHEGRSGDTTGIKADNGSFQSYRYSNIMYESE